MKELSDETGVRISVELGLQTASYRTLERINRGHGLAEFIRASLACQQYGFAVCAHVILNLPWDSRTDVADDSENRYPRSAWTAQNSTPSTF